MDKNLAKGMPTNYLSLTMPAETRNYIPKLIAVKNIIADPQRFGINFASIPNESLIASLTLKRHIDVAVAAKFAGMTKEAFRFLNPANNRPVINADMSETILLPKERVEKFMAHMNDNANKPLISIKTHTVNSGEKLESIANDHHISVMQLKQMNNITPRQRIITGQTILVPAGNELEPELKELSPPSFIPVVKKIQHAAKQKSTSKNHLARQDHHRDTHAQPVAVHKKRVTQQKPKTPKTSSIGLALR
jgi:membrane-bound lytic murein transglycosylase D